MPRHPRLFVPGAIYHVYCRTARGEMVFSDRDHAAEFVEIVADVKRLHDFEIFAWCLNGYLMGGVLYKKASTGMAIGACLSGYAWIAARAR